MKLTTSTLLIFEPRVGIGPTTSSFAYTFSSNAAMRRARLYLCPAKYWTPLSVVRALNVSATVLASGAINRYSGFTNLLPKKWAGLATHHGRALPTELSRQTRNRMKVFFYSFRVQPEKNFFESSRNKFIAANLVPLSHR